jgi:hypothetical protein
MRPGNQLIYHSHPAAGTIRRNSLRLKAHLAGHAVYQIVAEGEMRA